MHRLNLSFHSVVFRYMFERVKGVEGLGESRPVIPLMETSTILEVVLPYFYTAPIDELRGKFELADVMRLTKAVPGFTSQSLAAFSLVIRDPAHPFANFWISSISSLHDISRSSPLTPPLRSQ